MLQSARIISPPVRHAIPYSCSRRYNALTDQGEGIEILYIDAGSSRLPAWHSLASHGADATLPLMPSVGRFHVRT